MSLLQKATIITTPTAHSEGKLHSIKGGSVADFDVVRGSGATRVNKDGLIEAMTGNEPRLDYTDSSCPSLLLENQSTNLLPYSEDLNQASTVVNATISLNQGSSPKGDDSASKFTANTAFPNARIGVTTVVNEKYTTSLYVKYEGYQFILLDFKANFNDGSSGAWFDIVNGVIGTTQSNITSTKIEELSDNWYRISATSKSTSSGTGQVRIHLCDTDGASTISGSTGLSNFVWGAQVEELSYATSYIPTSGAIATRLADSVTGAGDATTFNSTEGVLYVEMAALANDLTNRTIALSDGTVSNTVRIQYLTVSNAIWATVTNVGAGGNQAILQYTSSDITINSKIALKYKENDFALWVDGVKVSTDTSGVTFSANTLNTLQLNRGNGAEALTGKVKSVITFDTALTDAELECLTTI